MAKHRTGNGIFVTLKIESRSLRLLQSGGRQFRWLKNSDFVFNNQRKICIHSVLIYLTMKNTSAFAWWFIVGKSSPNLSGGNYISHYHCMWIQSFHQTISKQKPCHLHHLIQHDSKSKDPSIHKILMLWNKKKNTFNGWLSTVLVLYECMVLRAFNDIGDNLNQLFLNLMWTCSHNPVLFNPTRFWFEDVL